MGAPREDAQFRPTVRLGGYRLTTDAASQYESRSVVTTLANPTFNVPLQPPTTYNFMNNDVALLLLNEPSTMPRLQLIGKKRE